MVGQVSLSAYEKASLEIQRRIAAALERIADALEGAPTPQLIEEKQVGDLYVRRYLYDREGTDGTAPEREGTADADRGGEEGSEVSDAPESKGT